MSDLWPLKPCDPRRMPGGELYCRTHSTDIFHDRYSYPYEVTRHLVGWQLPPEGSLCLRAVEVTQIAEAVLDGLLDRRRNAPEPMVGRGTGRSTALLKWAAEENPNGPMRLIVCGTQRECRHLFEMSMVDGVSTIRFPVTWREMVKLRGLPRDVEFAIDNLFGILNQVVPGTIGPVAW